MKETTFQNKCNILSELWMNYRNDPNFEDFISYSDLGLPLAYAFANGLATPTGASEKFVGETFYLLLNSLEVTDTGFNDLDEIFVAAN